MLIMCVFSEPSSLTADTTNIIIVKKFEISQEYQHVTQRHEVSDDPVPIPIHLLGSWSGSHAFSPTLPSLLKNECLINPRLLQKL